MPRDTVPTEGSRASGPLEKDDAFLADYYEHVAAEDLHDYSVATLELRAREHLDLARVRPPGTSRVAVVNERDAGLVLVVTDDLPHTLRSVTAELTHGGAPIRLLVHPTFTVRRDPSTHGLLEVRHGPRRSGLGAAAGGTESGPVTGSGARTGTGSAADSAAAAATEIWIAAETSRLADESGAHRLEARLQKVLADVRDAAGDEGALHARMAATVKNVSAFPDGCVPPAAELAELLRWLEGGNFLVLGACDYERTTAEGRVILTRRPGSGLGLLRRHRLPDGATPAPRSERVLTFVTSGLRSSVERNAYLEEVRLSTFNDAGTATGERCFVGLLTPGAAGPSLRRIPVIRDEVAAVQSQLGIPRASHEATELAAALESLPLSELFHLEIDELTRLAGEIVRLQERRQTRLFLRQDPRGHFLTALFFLPRHRYTTAVGLRIERELKQALRATSIEFDVRVSQPMARVSCRVLLPPDAFLEALDATELERRLLETTRTWTEGLSDAIRSRWPSRAARLTALWSGAFPASYQAEVSVDDALEDIRQFERFDLDGAGGRPLSDPLLTVSAGAGAAAAPREARVRLYLTGPRTLTQILPVFHNLGLEVLNERPFDLVRGADQPLFLYELDVRYPTGVDPVDTSSLLSDAFGAAMRGDSESDRFDALVLREGVGWRQVAILRAYAKYLLQLGTTNSYDFIADALLANGTATHALLGLFHARFDPGLPAAHRLGGTAAARAATIEAIDAVASLDADRLLRTFLNLIEATTRTNFYRGQPYLSFKLQPSHLRSAPQPRPRFEIWVYSPRVEGVHLRFGPVARGGLRWSDRREDFRTEVLGLAKAQIVKNSVIVPTGAKGGFFPKRLPDPDADRAAWLAEGIEAYRDFLRGLLDLTDNLALPDDVTPPDVRSRGSVGRVIPPPGVVRHDDDDYYLVVAADKGTAALSDVANEVANEYGF